MHLTTLILTMIPVNSGHFSCLPAIFLKQVSLNANNHLLTPKKARLGFGNLGRSRIRDRPGRAGSKRDCTRVSTPCGGAFGGPSCWRNLSNRVFINPLSPPDIKKPACAGVFMSGGERGIRTLDTLLTYTPLAGERFRPLSHLSELSV